MGGANAGLAPPPEQVESTDSAPSEGMESEQQLTAGEEIQMEQGDSSEARDGGRGEMSEREEITVTTTDEDTARETEGGEGSEREGATDAGEREESEREGARGTAGEQEENKEPKPSDKECTPSYAGADTTLAPAADGEEQATQQTTDKKEGEMEQKMETN